MNYVHRMKMIFMLLLTLPVSLSWGASEGTVTNRPFTDADQVSTDPSIPSAEVSSEQMSGPRDDEITQRIRQNLMKDPTLSIYGKNIKVITIDGRVTLRGLVRTAEEEKSVLTSARTVARSANVTDKMIIKK